MTREDFIECIQSALQQFDAPRLARLAYQLLDTQDAEPEPESDTEPPTSSVPLTPSLTLPVPTYVGTPTYQAMTLQGLKDFLQSLHYDNSITLQDICAYPCPFQGYIVKLPDGSQKVVLWDMRDPIHSVLASLSANNIVSVSWVIRM
jgi:hypothetical protein